MKSWPCSSLRHDHTEAEERSIRVPLQEVSSALFSLKEVTASLGLRVL